MSPSTTCSAPSGRRCASSPSPTPCRTYLGVDADGDHHDEHHPTSRGTTRSCSDCSRPSGATCGRSWPTPLAVGLTSLVLPLVSQALIDAISLGVYTNQMLVLGGVVAIGMLMNGGFGVVQHYAVDLLQRRIFVRTGLDIARRLPRIQHGAFNEHLRARAGQPLLRRRQPPEVAREAAHGRSGVRARRDREPGAAGRLQPVLPGAERRRGPVRAVRRVRARPGRAGARAWTRATRSTRSRGGSKRSAARRPSFKLYAPPPYVHARADAIAARLRARPRAALPRHPAAPVGREPALPHHRHARGARHRRRCSSSTGSSRWASSWPPSWRCCRCWARSTGWWRCWSTASTCSRPSTSCRT